MQLKNLDLSSPSEPVSVADAKSFARITSTTEDTLIGELITSARIKAEKVLGRSLAAHSFQVEVTEHEGDIELPYPPTATVTKVEYRDTSNDWWELTLDTDYFVTGLTDWIITISQYYQHVRVTYTTTAYDNEDVNRLIKELVTCYYDNRPDSEGIEQAIINKIAKYKIWQAM